MNLYELIMSGLVLDQSCGSSDTDLMSKSKNSQPHRFLIGIMPSHVKNSISPLQALKDHLSAAVKYFRCGGCIEHVQVSCERTTEALAPDLIPPGRHPNNHCVVDLHCR
jgi:hypothetical protein